MFVCGRIRLLFSVLIVSLYLGTFSETSRTPCGCNLYLAGIIRHPELGDQSDDGEFIHDGPLSVLYSSAPAETDGSSPRCTLSIRGTSYMEKESYRA
jgi:hypothetical protein